MYEELIKRHERAYLRESDHVYFVDDEEGFTSGTTLISEYHQHFDADKIAAKKAPSNDMLQEWYKLQWTMSAPKGTFIHFVLEQYALSLDDEFRYIKWIKDLEELQKDYLTKEEHYSIIEGTRLIESLIKDGWEVVQPELICWDKEYMVAGSVDLLMKRNDELMIVDHKTCTNIFSHNYGKYFYPPLQEVGDSKLMHYILQLNLYKNFIERVCDLPVTHMKILHIPSGKKGSLIDIDERQDLVEIMLNDRKNKLINNK